MKLVPKAVVSLVSGGCVVYATASFTSERFEPVLYWTLPFFHKIFRPLTAGPNPKAMICALLTDTALITALAFLLLGFKKQRQKET